MLERSELASIRRGTIVLLSTCAAIGLLILSAGCFRGSNSSRSPIHPNPNMDLQPKYKAQAESDFFYDGKTMRIPVEGTVARGALGEDTVFYEGKDASGAFAPSGPIAVDEAFLERGAERYGIYCQPCHGGRGDGRGVLWERAQIESRDLSEARIREMPDGQLFDIITNGLGLMQGYRYPIPPRDRWAIIAYVRQLQERSDAS